MSRQLKITVLMDTAAIPDKDPDFMGTSEKPTTEYHVIRTLREPRPMPHGRGELGNKVSVLGAVSDVGTIVNKLSEQKPDMVFNLTEEFAGDRRQDKNIAALLELLGVAFTGTGATGLMLCRDKRLCKQLLGLHKIRIPGFVFLPPRQTVRIPKSLCYPLVVKPVFEDSSEGISNASLVTNEAALRERAQFIHERWQQAAIAEQYVQGRELYVSLLGNKRLTVLPIRECFFKSDTNSGPLLATYRVKWNEQYRQKWNIQFGFAELDASILESIERVCRKVYRALQIRDYGRIDLRLTPDGRLVVLEANPNPDIAFGEEVAEAAERAGIPYKNLIDRILHLALRRYS
jgi:D-alanine-D-alanine ligase